MDMTSNCARCEFFDGDAYCTLPRERRKLAGYIYEAESVVCSEFHLHEDHRTLEVLNEADRQTALDGAAYENALSRLGGQY